MKNLFSLTLVGIIFIFLKFVTATSEYDAGDYDDLSGLRSGDSLDKSETPTVLGVNLHYRDLDSKSKLSKKVQAKATPSDCVSIFDGDRPDEKVLKCLQEGFNQSRCGSDGDFPCLCDSLFIHQVVTNCTGFPNFDPLFSAYYKELCKRGSVPPPNCTDIPNPSFPTITCQDPFKESGFNQSLKDCLTNGIDKSLCKSHKNASCLCDSISAGNHMMNCTKDSKTKESLKKFLDSFCQHPLEVSGCVTPSGLLLEVELGGDGIALKVMDLKKLILLIIGIIIPITLGLIDN